MKLENGSVVWNTEIVTDQVHDEGAPPWGRQKFRPPQKAGPPTTIEAMQCTTVETD